MVLLTTAVIVKAAGILTCLQLDLTLKKESLKIPEEDKLIFRQL